jgi:phage terminase large subunit-like protein
MLPYNLMIAATPAQHFSAGGITDRNKTLWASWVIKTPFRKLFLAEIWVTSAALNKLATGTVHLT